MRIVQIIPNFGLGGIQKAGCVLAAAMAQAGNEVWVAGRAGGARFVAAESGNLRHLICGSASLLLRTVMSVKPDVIHIHDAAYVEDLVKLLSERTNSLIVSTPVFGRPPHDATLLLRTRTCLVGTYTFYRFCKWFGLAADEAVARGIGFVPLTPFDPPSVPISALDSQAEILKRRASFGLPEGSTVVGRIGRATPGKWHASCEDVVDGMLARVKGSAWLSAGFPESRGRSRLQEKWGPRFIDVPETNDYDALATVLSSLDIGVYFGYGECFSASICEAISLGVPQIALSTPLLDNGQSEQVIEGVTGFLVGGADAAIAALDALQSRPDELLALKRRARSYAYANWHRDTVATHLLQLYAAWRDPTAGRTPYMATMLDQHARFSANYHERVIAVAGKRKALQAGLSIMLNACEYWPFFKVGRAIKRANRIVVDAITQLSARHT